MFYTKKIKDAIRVAIRVHELDQKQKRKGKDVPYIIHPLIVGLILSRVNAEEDMVVAGILHDTIEDSVESKKITRADLEKRFGKEVASIVWDVTEKDQKIKWEERKKRALREIKSMPLKSLIVKSADTIANCSELIADFRKEGESTFRRFAMPKEKQLGHYINVIRVIKKRTKLNPLAKDLTENLKQLKGILAIG